MVTSRGRTRVTLLRLALCYSVVPLGLAHKLIPYKDRKKSQGVVTSRRRTRVTLLRLAFCYSVVPLGLAHKLIPYKDRKKSQGVVTSRRRTRVTLLRLALCYSVVPLRINPYLTKIEMNYEVWSHREEGPGSHYLD